MPEHDSGKPAGRGAAFFDLDKTLMAGSSAMQFARAARARGVVSRRQLARWGRDHLKYRLRGATDDETDATISQASELMKGIPGAEINRMGVDALAGILPRIYPEMLEEVYHHQDEGRPTFIVSAAGDGIVSALARVLGMTDGIGTRYETDADGNYTGRLEGPFVYGEGKVTAMERYAAQHEIDLDASYAYSDSASDLPMLRAVGNAVVVNPDAELLAVARQEGWRVLRFEKLGRKLAIGGATGAALALGGIGSTVAGRRRRSARRLPKRMR